MLRARTVVLDRGQGCVGVYVTGTRAIAQLTHRIPYIRVLVFLVRPRPVTVGVATRTIRLIRGCCVRDGFAIRQVASGTG